MGVSSFCLGRIIVPGTTYLQLVWETLAMMIKGAISPVVNVEFQDVRFLRATTMSPGQKIDFTIMVRIEINMFCNINKITKKNNL